MMNHTTGTIRTNLHVNTILSAVVLIFMTIISFFLVRLIAQLDSQEDRLNIAERNIVKIEGTLKVLDERTVVIAKSSENIERKVDRMWEEIKK